VFVSSSRTGFNSAAQTQNGAVRASGIVAESDRLSGSGGDGGFQDGVAKGGQGMASLRELQELLKAARSDEPVKLIRTFNIWFHGRLPAV
jgi:hypothetical protein